MPAFINLQQYYAEAYLVDRVQQLPQIDLRWRNKVTALEQHNDHAVLTIETPDGAYRLAADYVVACDGARSALRGMVGAEFEGEVFEDQFLIADVKMTAEFPTERWFWFDPPFHSGQSALLHRQPDDVWRIDLQIGADADAGDRAAAGERPAADRAHARPWRFSVRMDLDLQIPVPADAALPARAGDLRRRFRASGVAVRRARRQFRAGGRRESGLETGDGAARRGRRRACSRATRSSAARPPTTTSGTRPARPISSRRIPSRSAGCATPCWRSPRTSTSPSAWSMPAGCRRRRSTTARCRRRTSKPGAAARGPARRCSMRR